MFKKSYLYISLSIMFFCTTLLTQEPTKEEYSLKINKDRSFSIFKKETILFPSGSINKITPIEELPEGYSIEEETRLDVCKRVFEKYYKEIMIEAGINCASAIGKHQYPAANYPNTHKYLDFTNYLTYLAFAYSLVHIGHDALTAGRQLKIVKKESSDQEEPSKAAEFFTQKAHTNEK